MLIPVRTSQFKRDVKLALKRGKNLEKLTTLMKKLVSEFPLDTRYKDHKLTGDYKDHRECHVEPDWLLIYRISGDEIYFERTGSHSDLFKK